MIPFIFEQCFVCFLSVLECILVRRQSWASSKMFGITCYSNRVLPDKVCFQLSTFFDIWKHINYNYFRRSICKAHSSKLKYDVLTIYVWLYALYYWNLSIQCGRIYQIHCLALKTWHKVIYHKSVSALASMILSGDMY